MLLLTLILVVNKGHWIFKQREVTSSESQKSAEMIKVVDNVKHNEIKSKNNSYQSLFHFSIYKHHLTLSVALTH